ncbi:major facilitator superfamily domain-containing protein [Ilyonectria robusta]|uniref:major facilitator superfamily domain-containing protein n=1 Tax=Ilyonectria robusta TaxID=1079257 RepID=UPI001E8D6F82|nr:major facilitator superfamily domain-containing protein [Ilyonectria robusta]KAH8688241.1 major facilitator superfamily domain-containing protein [Ilyonectria robusta]
MTAPSSSENEDQASIDALPPTDRGRGAYIALACCTVAQAPIWGYSVAFGIFQEYYTAQSDIEASPSAIASIGASQTGIMYLMMPLAFILLNRYPRLRRWCGPLGLLITVASLTASAFASNIGALIATQGVFYALGCSLIFSPISLYMDEWFVERKGFAYGVMWAGKSAVGVVMPFLFSALLRRFGPRSTLLSWAIASVVLTSPTLLFLKPRVELSRDSRARPISFSFLRSASFWMLQIGIIIQSLGYLMPSTYLASYASAIGLSAVTGPILLALFSLASVPGSLIHGMLGDRVSASKVILVSSLGSAVPVFLLWGLSRHISTMVLFVIFYGFFAGGFSSTWSAALQDIKGDNESIDTSLVFGMLLGGRGLGFIIAGPLSGALVAAGSSISGDALGYATKYGPMILCTGVTAILGAWAPLWKATKAVSSTRLGACMRVTAA